MAIIATISGMVEMAPLKIVLFGVVYGLGFTTCIFSLSQSRPEPVTTDIMTCPAYASYVDTISPTISNSQQDASHVCTPVIKKKRGNGTSTVFRWFSWLKNLHLSRGFPWPPLITTIEPSWASCARSVLSCSSISWVSSHNETVPDFPVMMWKST